LNDNIASKWSNDQSWNASWVVLEQLTGGGQASVKRVQNRVSGDVAFLKVLNKQKEAERRRRFFREASAYATCVHKAMPQLVMSNAIHHEDLGFDLFIVTEFVTGVTLAKFVEQCGPLPFEDAVTFALALLDVVIYLHEQHWVHRDIKPDNIVFRNSAVGSPVLVDFGLSFKDGSVSDFRTAEGEEIGNRCLRLPELGPGSLLKQDERSDTAFVGGMLFYALTGSCPHQPIDTDGRMPHQRAPHMQMLRDRAQSADMAIMGIFDRCFSFRLSDRFSSQDLRAAISQLTEAKKVVRPANADQVMNDVVERLRAQANQRLNRQRNAMETGLRAVDKIHAQVLAPVADTYVRRQSAPPALPYRRGNGLGFAHASNHQHFIQVNILFDIAGDELVVSADGFVIYRTNAEEPVFDDLFAERVRDAFVRALDELSRRPL
jgi:serine/threonine-protein kinase